MRLWHIDLIPFLPDSQLLAQWRELNSIFKKHDKHILINYIYNYDDEYLFDYTCMVLKEFRNRNFKIKNTINFYNRFYQFSFDGVIPLKNNYEYKFKEHNRDYLNICFYNLMEKYLRGQKDFHYYTWNKLCKFYIEKESGFIKEDLKNDFK